MKSLIQVVMAFAVLVGGVFLVTFLTQFTRKPSSTAGESDTPVLSKELLELKQNKAKWDDLDGYNLEVEKQTTGNYDFLVANAKDKPVVVALDSKFSCTCANMIVQIGIVAAAEREKLKDVKPPPAGPALQPYLTGIKWKTLPTEREQPSVSETIPAADAAGPQFAVIRLAWEAKDIKITTFTADLRARAGSATDYLHFEVPINITPPVLASHEHLPLGDLNPGDKREASFVVWSPTRDRITADPKMVADDPCIDVSEPRPLTAEELKKLPGELIAVGQVKHLTRPRCAYEIKVTVSERRGDNQLELGPLSRKIYVNRGSDTEQAVILSGTVRGSIRVGRPDDHDRVDLGVFSTGHGSEKTVQIMSTGPDVVELAIDHVKPDGLKVELVESKSGFGPRRWKLTVVAPPNALAGPLPPDSAIYLKTQANPPRRVRIPVAGNASG